MAGKEKLHDNGMTRHPERPRIPSAVIRMRFSIRPTLLALIREGPDETAFRSPWSAALHERLPASWTIGPRVGSGGRASCRPLGPDHRFASREPLRLSPYDRRVAAEFYRVFLQLPGQCAGSRRPGQGYEARSARLFHLCWRP